MRLELVLSLFSVLCSTGFCRSANDTSHTITVDDLTGVDNSTCLSNEGFPCKTIQFAFKHLQNNTQIRLLPGVQPLTEPVSVSFLHDIAIVGSVPPEVVLIKCSAGKSNNPGMMFNLVRNLEISGVSVQNCGSLQNSSSSRVGKHKAADHSAVAMFRSAVNFLNCTNVTVLNSEFVSNPGIGITMSDMNGQVIIDSCVFSNNSVPVDEQLIYPGGGGLYIKDNSGYTEFDAFGSYVTNGCNYFIQNSNFTNNSANTKIIDVFTFPDKRKGPILLSLGNGAGLLIALKEFASNNSFMIHDCTFTNNWAFLGGAVAIQIDDKAVDNNIVFKGGNMAWNHAVQGGGAIEFGFFNAHFLERNSLLFQGYTFDSNQAVYGGGVAFYSARVHDYFSSKTIEFSNCHWVSNTASVGAAVALFPEDWTYISSGYVPTPVFHNCRFSRNQVVSLDTDHQTNSQGFSKPSLSGGIVYSDTYSINISGNVTFSDNSGSCIHISAAQVNVQAFSSLRMDSNYALRGAGLSLVGYAALMVCENSTVTFINNTAEDLGGAVYYDSIDLLEFINSRRCFFRYSEFVSPSNWATEFVFINNTAKKYGHSIYATSLLPCARANPINQSEIDIKKLFVSWKQFHFEPIKEYMITTDPATIKLNNTSIEATPGNTTRLGIEILDDLNQSMDTVLFASCDSNCGSVIMQGSEYITNNETTIKGSTVSGDDIIMHLSTINNRPIGIDLNITLMQCAPGYYLNGYECACSITNSSHKLPGIVACNEKLQQGYLEVGYWAGLYKDSLPATAECPPGYCDYPTDHYNGFVQLPPSYGSLNDLFCVPKNRRGFVCGKCLEDYSVYYHSDRFKCEKCDSELGPLFYILSELFPLTILFLVVIIFDINLMSGIASSFIFFAQTLDFFQVTLGDYNLPSAIKVLTQIYWFVLGFFNLEFFRADKLSFCLFRNATTLDILAFKYITTAYGLLLVCLLFLLMNTFRCHKIIGRCRKNADSSQYTVMNGLTAFLVITYSQCAKVSFELLSQLSVSIEGDSASIEHVNVVLLAGHIPYFSNQHLKYAIPAIVCLCYLLFIPIFFIGHPLYFLCKKWTISKHRTSTNGEEYVNCRQNCSSFTLFLKPILDAFQAPYKDDARWFAGVMFFYRLVMSALFSLNTTTLTAFSSLEVFLILVLLVRTIIHPFRKRIHNTIESLMFTNLAIINGITLYNTVSSQLQSEIFLNELLTIQLVLINIPIVLIAVYAVYRGLEFFGLLKNRQWCQRCQTGSLRGERRENIFDPIGINTVEISSSFNASHLPARLFESDKDSAYYRLHDDEEDDDSTAGQRDYGTVQ